MSNVVNIASEAQEFLATFRQRVADDLQILSAIHDREPDLTLLQELKMFDFPNSLTILPDTETGNNALNVMQQALSVMDSQTDEKIFDELAADYASIYLNHNISASPEESVWIDEDSLMCQDSMFQVRAWYESYGLGIPDWRLRPDDHLVYELQFLACLLEKDNEFKTLQTMARFMDEHLLRWLGNFAERVLVRCATPYFAGAAAITATYCEQLRDILAEILDQPRPSREEIDERMQPKQAHTVDMPLQFMPGMGPAV